MKMKFIHSRLLRCNVLARRFCTSSIGTGIQDNFATIADGSTVALPPNLDKFVIPSTITDYGLKAVIPQIGFANSENGRKIENDIEKSRLQYLRYRKRLIQTFEGFWIGTVPDGDVVVFGESEDIVVDKLWNLIGFDGKYKGIYVNCIGREYVTTVQMGIPQMDSSLNVDYVPTLGDLDEHGVYIGKHDSSLFIKCEHSPHLDEPFNAYAMKYDMGAAGNMMPESIFADFYDRYPNLRKRPTKYAQQSSTMTARCLKWQYFRISGLITIFPCLEMKNARNNPARWLIGAPTLLRYRNIIDKSETKLSRVIMKPLAGENDILPRGRKSF